MAFTVARPLDPLAVEAAQLGGTIAGLARAAVAAGFEVECRRGFGVRIPKTGVQAYRWQAWTCLYGRHVDGRAFQARNDDEGWHVDIKRLGWPRLPGTTKSLRAMFKGGA